jgi:hypothetical protein
MDLFLLVNDHEKKYAFAPAHSQFNLGDTWVPTWISDCADYAGTYLLPCKDMRDEVQHYVAPDYAEVPFQELVPTIGWVLRSDYRVFLKLYKETYAATQRRGQAFLNHFNDRFPDPWPELFYCEDDNKVMAMLNDKVF